MIKINRRNLLVGMGLAGVSAAMLPRSSVAQGKKHLKILILGGTGLIVGERSWRPVTRTAHLKLLMYVIWPHFIFDYWKMNSPVFLMQQVPQAGSVLVVC
jgi:hypothetical protein